MEDKRGDVWICTEGGGLNYLHRDSRQFTHYLTDEKSVSPLFSNLKCIEYDEGRDYLYIGTHKQGFFCFDITARKVVYHTERWEISFQIICVETAFIFFPVTVCMSRI